MLGLLAVDGVDEGVDAVPAPDGPSILLCLAHALQDAARLLPVELIEVIVVFPLVVPLQTVIDPIIFLPYFIDD